MSCRPACMRSGCGLPSPRRRGGSRGRTNRSAPSHAAAALYVAGMATGFEDGVEMAREALFAGSGLAALDRLKAAFAAQLSD